MSHGHGDVGRGPTHNYHSGPVSASSGAPSSSLRRLAGSVASRLPLLVDAYRYVKHPEWERVVKRDLEETRAGGAFLRALSPAAADAPVALVALYRDNIYDTKVGLILATALRLRGLDPVVLMPNGRGHRIRRYAEAFGIERVIVADSLALSDAEQRECDAAVASLLATDPDIDGMKEWTFRGGGAGYHVLSSLIRATFDGSPDLKFDENRSRLAAIAHRVAANYVRADRLVAELAPRCLLVEEANYVTNGPLVDVATSKGIDVISTQTIWRDDALMSKRLTATTRRVDTKSVAPDTFAQIVTQPWSDTEEAELTTDFDRRYGGAWQQGRQFQFDTEARSAAELVAELGLDPDRPTAVVFAHVLWDMSLFFGVDLFANYADWLEQTVTAAVANPRVNWVVKAHPSNVFRVAHGQVGGESSEANLVRDLFPVLPDHVRLLLPDTKISTRSIYEFADYGVTVRGTPGLEMACLGKRTLTAGSGSYSGLGFTTDSASCEQYLARLATIETEAAMSHEEVRRARVYAHSLFLRRPWRPRSFENRIDFPEGGWHPLDRNAVLTARRVEEIRAAGDLEQWAAWVLDTEDADFLPTGSVSVLAT